MTKQTTIVVIGCLRVNAILTTIVVIGSLRVNAILSEVGVKI